MSLIGWWVSQWTQCEQQTAHDQPPHSLRDDEGKRFSKWRKLRFLSDRYICCYAVLKCSKSFQKHTVDIFDWFLSPIFLSGCCVHIMSYLGGLGHWGSANKSSVLIISDQWEASIIIAPPLGVKPRCCLLSWEGNRRKPGGLVKYLNTARYMKWDIILSVYWPGERGEIDEN